MKKHIEKTAENNSKTGSWPMPVLQLHMWLKAFRSEVMELFEMPLDSRGVSVCMLSLCEIFLGRDADFLILRHGRPQGFWG